MLSFSGSVIFVSNIDLTKYVVDSFTVFFFQDIFSLDPINANVNLRSSFPE